MSTDTLDQIDIITDEDLEKGPRCQATHDECTIQAVAMGHPTCGTFPTLLVCQWVVDFFEHAVSIGGLCGDCQRPIQDCWKFVAL